MGLFRSDIQVALHTLHVAIPESADNYVTAAEYLEDPQASMHVLLLPVSAMRWRGNSPSR